MLRDSQEYRRFMIEFYPSSSKIVEEIIKYPIFNQDPTIKRKILDQLKIYYDYAQERESRDVDDVFSGPQRRRYPQFMESALVSLGVLLAQTEAVMGNTYFQLGRGISQNYNSPSLTQSLIQSTSELATSMIFDNPLVSSIDNPRMNEIVPYSNTPLTQENWLPQFNEMVNITYDNIEESPYIGDMYWFQNASLALMAIGSVGVLLERYSARSIVSGDTNSLIREELFGRRWERCIEELKAIITGSQNDSLTELKKLLKDEDQDLFFWEWLDLDKTQVPDKVLEKAKECGLVTTNGPTIEEVVASALEFTHGDISKSADLVLGTQSRL